MRFHVEYFPVNGKPSIVEDVEADYYKHEGGFVVFYEKVSEPTETESGLILSVGDKEVNRIFYSVNASAVKFISPDWGEVIGDDPTF